MTFFSNADSVPVVSSSSGSGQIQATKFSSCVFDAKFFIKDAVKSATLLAHAVFASVNSSSIGLERSRTQLSLTNCTTLLSHDLESTMTATKTGAVGIMQRMSLKIIPYWLPMLTFHLWLILTTMGIGI